jgi:hypothetical protein
MVLRSISRSGPAPNDPDGNTTGLKFSERGIAGYRFRAILGVVRITASEPPSGGL